MILAEAFVFSSYAASALSFVLETNFHCRDFGGNSDFFRGTNFDVPLIANDPRKLRRC